MSQYRKKPVVVGATQWFKNGDHPADECYPIDDGEGGTFKNEGKVVRYFRHPGIPGQQPCSKCGQVMHVHGWIDTLEDGHNVCPGDWIITGVKGEYYPCKPDVFALTYEPAAPPALPDEARELREKVFAAFKDETMALVHQKILSRDDAQAIASAFARIAAHFIERLAPRWISVEERLPERGVVLAVTADKQIDMYQWNLVAGYANDPDASARITHWQPLPLPPQKGST